MSQKNFVESKNAAFLAQMKARREQGIPSGIPTKFATAPGMTAEKQELEWLQEQLDLARKSEVEIDSLYEVPGRRRTLTESQFLELKNNLSTNPLVTAITIRKRAEGGFEIISGHNRVAAYKELGHKTIKAIVIDGDEYQSTLNAFYANLIQPSLPDFEKYLGFKKIHETTGKTQKEMALEAGIDPSLVTLLFSFSDLPEKALDIIKTSPEIIGASAASSLAKLTKQGKATEVEKAIELLYLGKINQAAAIRLASKGQEEKQINKPKSTKILNGKALFAEMIGYGPSLRINFKTEDDRRKMEKLFEKVIKDSFGKDD